MKDRRKCRSNNPIEAAEMYLNAAAQRRDYRALALANAEGSIVARAESPLDSRAIAAVAPFAENVHETDVGLLHLVTRGQQLRVWDVTLSGNPHYLAAVGGSEQPPSEVERTLRRILN
ncbi:MAG: hypothetical protein VX589_15295 [Myxococcota bacterium]|nr:hypothetical protein [Myxococcota bacterium]